MDEVKNRFKEEFETIRELERDLSATYTTRESGHYETWKSGSCGGGCSRESVSEDWVVDSPSETLPDERTMRIAQRKLEEIYRKSPWCSVKYGALQTLSTDQEKLSEYADKWIDFLDMRLSSEIRMGSAWTERDLKNMYDIAHNNEIRKKAGESLGYSSLRIWLGNNKKHCLT